MSYLKFPRLQCEHYYKREKYTRELFLSFYGKDILSRPEKAQFEGDYPKFNITTEMERFLQFLNVSVNVYKYSLEQKKYVKEHYYHKEQSQYLLNVAIADLEDGKHHAIWLANVDSALHCYAYT
jgi:hypothetical protein